MNKARDSFAIIFYCSCTHLHLDSSFLFLDSCICKLPNNLNLAWKLQSTSNWAFYFIIQLQQISVHVSTPLLTCGFFFLSVLFLSHFSNTSTTWEKCLLTIIQLSYKSSFRECFWQMQLWGRVFWQIYFFHLTLTQSFLLIVSDVSTTAFQRE